MVLAGRRKETLERTMSLAPKESACLAVPADVREESSVDALFRATRERFGRLDVRHVADAVVHMAGLPLSSNVQFLTLMATKMPFIGRG